MQSAKTLSILGATGSVGGSAVAVVEEMRARGEPIQVEAVTAGRNLPALVDVVRRLSPRYAALADPTLLEAAREALKGLSCEVGVGDAAVLEAAARPSDLVLAAIVGAAGLMPTMAAVDRGARVALANKECLVCAGEVMTAAAKASGAMLLPVDSEHSAIFQVWEGPQSAERITLTASGGPFRTLTLAEMSSVTPAQACAHPTWSMGAKISVDSATLMNKGFELIEAIHFFTLPEDRIDVVVHPQSIIHSLVHYVDGSVLAQLSEPDMRVPIAYALAWPRRTQVSTKRLDLPALRELTFFAPDPARFPALTLIREAAKAGGGASAGLNAANEVAVAAFLDTAIGFLDICRINAIVLDALVGGALSSIAKSPSSLDQVREVDAAARRLAQDAVKRAAL